VPFENTGLPPSVVEELMATLTAALRRLRADFRDRSEQVLAAEWLAGFKDRGAFLDDARGYFMIAHALTVNLDVLDFTAPEERLPMLSHVTKNWWYAVLETKEPDDDYGAAILSSFDKHDIPRPAQNGPFDLTCQRAAVLGVVESISSVHRYLGGGVLTDEVMAEQRVLSLAGHALNAPEDVWTHLTAAAPAPERETVAPSVFPNDLATTIVTAEVRLRNAISAAEEQHARLIAADVSVRTDLENGELSAATQAVLTSVGIDLDAVRAIIAHRKEHDKAGFLKRLAMGAASKDMLAERSRIKHLWAIQLDVARNAVRDATAARGQELAAFEPQLAAFAPGPDSKVGDHLRPRRDYIGAMLAEMGLAERLPHTLWTSSLVEDRSWALPQLANLHPNVVLFSDESALPYQHACAAARNMVLDKMSRTAPRQLLLTWLDPVGRGQSAGPFLELLEVDKTMLDEKVWSEPEEIATALRRVSDRMGMLEQRCLKDTFEDLESYNEHAGSLAEPYHVVVVTGFPRGFTEDTAQRLKQITEQGARLGISVVTVLDQSARAELTVTTSKAHGYPVMVGRAGGNRPNLPSWWGKPTFPMGIWVAGHNGGPHAPVALSTVDSSVWTPCVFPTFDSAAAGAIVSGYATASQNAAAVTIDSVDLVAEDGAPATTASSVDIPLGLRGRGTPVELRLGRELSQHVLVGGLPGSGKSTLFHTIITTAARKYAPTELEMYLLDFKQGVEFQPYADGALPHARVVAVQSERDFGLSVLRGLRDEIDRRATLFRATGSDHLAEHRGRTGEPLPRVLVVVDEFQVMFAEDDAIAHECAKLLDHVVRQGRAFGVHTVLGTQTLRGSGTMSLLRGTLDQIAVRIVLKTAESDSRLFLGDDNPAGARLTRSGEAIFNPDGGRPEGNLEFQVAFTTDEARDGAVRRARERADAAGFGRWPLVFDGTRKITVDDDEQVGAWLAGTARPERRSIALHVGLPVAIGGSGAVALSRRGGRHLAVVHRDQAFATGSALVATVTAVRSSVVTPRVSIIECLGDDEDHADALQRLANWRGVVTWARRRPALVTTLVEAAAEVRRRIEDEDYGGQPWLIVLNALQRARELDGESYDENAPHRDLLVVLADGADVGVHLVITSDTVETVERRLGRGALDHFGARLVGQCSEDASQRILGSAAASKLGPAYALLDEPDDHRRETVRPFPSPEPTWVATATRD
jgi:hypothetical protein